MAKEFNYKYDNENRIIEKISSIFDWKFGKSHAYFGSKETYEYEEY